MTALPLPSRFVGIDVAKAHLDIHLLAERASWRIEYTPAAAGSLRRNEVITVTVLEC